jgi:hypothetical protein
MEEFLEIVRVKLNDISAFLNNLQTTIGLSTAVDDSINGKINRLTELLENAKVPTYYTEKTTIQNNSFYCTYEPADGLCLNDEITLYHPDEGTLIWEGIEFEHKKGILNDAFHAYDGWEIKVQYFYNKGIVTPAP